jgi:ketosteroid isomerase-like protein
MSSSNAALAREGYGAALRGDLSRLEELLDPDVRWHGGDPAAPGACRDRQQALVFISRAIDAQRIGELVDVEEVGDRVLVVMCPRRGAGEPPELTANVTTFRDGRVIEIVHYPTPEAARAAIGASRS